MIDDADVLCYSTVLYICIHICYSLPGASHPEFHVLKVCENYSFFWFVKKKVNTKMNTWLV